jgi:hypothetical protein
VTNMVAHLKRNTVPTMALVTKWIFLNDVLTWTSWAPPIYVDEMPEQQPEEWYFQEWYIQPIGINLSWLLALQLQKPKESTECYLRRCLAMVGTALDLER